MKYPTPIAPAMMPTIKLFMTLRAISRQATEYAESGGLGVDEFDSVAERIVHEGAFDAGENPVPRDRHAIRRELREQGFIVSNSKGGMRLARRRKWLFDAEVQLKISALEP
jgi:hypothetical protein